MILIFAKTYKNTRRNRYLLFTFARVVGRWVGMFSSKFVLHNGGGRSPAWTRVLACNAAAARALPWRHVSRRADNGRDDSGFIWWSLTATLQLRINTTGTLCRQQLVLSYAQNIWMYLLLKTVYQRSKKCIKNWRQWEMVLTRTPKSTKHWH